MKSAARLAALLFCLCLSLPARAAEVKTSGRYRYFVENGGAVIVEYNGVAENLIVPDTLGGKPVVAVGAFAFWQNEKTVSVTLPATVERIDPAAFGTCARLAEITLQNERYRFEDGALYDAQNAALHTVLFARKTDTFAVPDGVRSIGAYAFANHAELTRVTLPDSLESIGDSAFMWCESLDGVSLPDGLKSLGSRAFYFCKNLRSVDIPSGVTEIPDFAFLSCESLRNVALPDTLLAVGEAAFGYCLSLDTISLPEGAAINDNAFIGCPLEKTNSFRIIAQVSPSNSDVRRMARAARL